MMVGMQHRLGGRGIAVLAFLAAALFASMPLALVHHHHKDLQDSNHCALCVLASGQVTPPAIQPLPDLPLRVVAILGADGEALPDTPLIPDSRQRAPPVV